MKKIEHEYGGKKTNEVRAENEPEQRSLTTILGVRLPDGRTFQVAGTEEDLELLLELLARIPKEEKGSGVLVTIDDDAVYRSSTGEEVVRIPHGNAVQVPDVRPQLAALIKHTRTKETA